MAGSSGAGSEPFVPSCLPRPGCQRLCAVLGSDPAGCGVGTEDQCGCICEERFNGPCPDELNALLACTGAEPTVDCSARGRIFAGCENESVALDLCDFRAREQLCAQAFPACTPYCVAVTLNFCPRGPESVTSCLCGCEATLATTCESEFSAFMSCSNAAPQLTCAETGLPVAATCLDEWQALESCSQGSVPSAPDAG